MQKLPDDIDISPILRAIGCDERGVRIMAAKSRVERYILRDLPCGAANILKQDALSIGADAAIHRQSVNCGVKSTDVLLLATRSQLQRIAEKERDQPFGLKAIAEEITAEIGGFLDAPIAPLFVSPKSVKIMGIININSDSFNPPSRTAPSDVLARAEKMIAEGADILDIGAVSSRPGSQSVSAAEELARLQPAIDALYAAKIHEKAVLSLDSYEPIALNYALDRGFSLINDITGGRDDRVLALAAQFDAALCVMHMKGDPSSMQDDPRYTDVVDEVDRFFAERAARARAFGVRRLILDAGIGFGKTVGDNLRLINAHGHFLRHGYELLIGASRKSLIGGAVEDRLGGTIALHLKACEYGASIVRCHDVLEHAQAVKMLTALITSV
ncbi:dihydropteroate synthase [Campylobacterota bacterium]|nr:dihydropteroate synthase [Campylobacterota bacterium]